MRLPDTQTLDLELLAKGTISQAICCALVAVDESKLGSQPPLAVIDENSGSSFNGAVSYRRDDNDRFTINLSDLQGSCKRLLLVVWVYEEVRRVAGHLGQLSELTVRILGASSQPIAQFSSSPKSGVIESAALLMEIYYKSGWRIKADGGGFVGGLSTLASRLNLRPDVIARLRQSGSNRGADPTNPPPSAPPPSSRHPRSGGDTSSQGKIRLPDDWPGAVSPRIPASLLPGVARVFVQSHDGQTSTGTAFAITPGACMLTCHHVIEDAAQVHVQFHRSDVVRPATVLASCDRTDLAMLRVNDSWGVIQWFRLGARSEEPEIGTSVGLAGFPLGVDIGMEITYSQGIINSVRDAAGVRVLQVDAGAAPGSSGGPLFRLEDGMVIGVLSRGLGGSNMFGMHANFSVDLHEIYRLGWLDS
jgi:S1-C subfamily serine protease